MIRKSDIMCELQNTKTIAQATLNCLREMSIEPVATKRMLDDVREDISLIYSRQKKLSEDVSEIKRLLKQQTDNQINMYYADMMNDNELKRRVQQRLTENIDSDFSKIPTTIYPLGVETIVFADSDNFVNYQVESSSIMTVERSTSKRYPKYFVIVRIKNSYDVPMDYIDQITISKQTYEYIVENVLEKRLY